MNINGSFPLYNQFYEGQVSDVTALMYSGISGFLCQEKGNFAYVRSRGRVLYLTVNSWATLNLKYSSSLI